MYGRDYLWSSREQVLPNTTEHRIGIAMIKSIIVNLHNTKKVTSFLDTPYLSIFIFWKSSLDLSKAFVAFMSTEQVIRCTKHTLLIAWIKPSPPKSGCPGLRFSVIICSFLLKHCSTFCSCRIRTKNLISLLIGVWMESPLWVDKHY